MDDPSIINADGTWSKERYDEIVSKLTPFLRSCGYNPKKDIIFLPMSGLLGQNIKDPAPASACPWYKVGAPSTGSLGCSTWLHFPVRQIFETARRLHALQKLQSLTRRAVSMLATQYLCTFNTRPRVDSS